MKKKFCCEATRGMYEDYYKRQTGGEIPVFAGRRHQRGHGLGSVLSGLFRKVVPFIKDNVRNVGANLLRTGADIAQDMIKGKKFKEAAGKHIPSGLKRTAGDIEWKSANPQVKKVVTAVIGGDQSIKQNVRDPRRQNRVRRRRRRTDIFA
jgi:hypothetical protein